MCKAVGENPVMKQKYLCVVFVAFFFMLSVGIQNASAQTASKTSALDLYARGKGAIGMPHSNNTSKR